ncbi:hypothetical protein EDD17DRAFT_1535861 [Pisolithus thermaeus]|nr:hypothetical protein EDD17DRAFT_1535861 [Pisolithus thermaeus]
MAPPLHAFAAARKILESWVMGLLVPRSRPTSVRPACSVPWFLLDAGRNATQRASTGSGCDEPTHLPREKGKASSAIVVDVVGPFHASFRGSSSSFARKRAIQFFFVSDCCIVLKSHSRSIVPGCNGYVLHCRVWTFLPICQSVCFYSICSLQQC